MHYNQFSMVGACGRVLTIRFVWRRKRKDMERAYAAMTRQGYDDDSDDKLYGCVSKTRGKDIFHIALSGVGRSLLDTLIHEACHVGQFVSRNREISAELTAKLSSALIYELKKDKRSKLTL